MFSLLPTSFLREVMGGKKLPHPIFQTFDGLQRPYSSKPKTSPANSILMGSPDGMATMDPNHPHHKHLMTKLNNPSLKLGVITKQNLQEELKEQAKGIDEKLNKILELTEQTRIYAREILIQLSINNKSGRDLRGKDVKSSN